MPITVRQKREITDNQEPSTYIVPGSGMGSEIPEIKTDNTETYKQYQDNTIDLPDLGETTLSAPKNTGFLGGVKQLYQNIVGTGIEMDRAKDEAIKSSAKEARKKAWEGGASINQGEIIKGIGKNISAVVTGIAVPFTSVLNEDVTGKTGESVGKVLGLPFEVLYTDIANGLTLSGMEKEDAGYYAEGLATLVLFGIKGGKSKETAIAESVKLGETFKNGNIPPEIKAQFNKESFVMHPDIKTNGFKPEVYEKVTKNFAKYKNAFEKGDKAMMDKLKSETEALRKEEGARLYQESKNKKAFIDPGALFKDNKEKLAYDKLKEELKNFVADSGGTIDIRTIVDSGLAGFAINDPAREIALQEQLESEIKQDVLKLEYDLTDLKGNNIKELLEKKQEELGIEENIDYSNIIEDFKKRDELLRTGELDILNEGFKLTDLLYQRGDLGTVIREVAKDLQLSEKIEVVQNQLRDVTEQNPSYTKILEDIRKNTEEIKQKQPPESEIIKEDGYRKEDLFSEKEIKKVDETLGKLNNFQEIKAKMGVKDTIKSFEKFTTIRELENANVIAYKGLDKQNPKLRKYEFTPIAREYFNIGENEDLSFLKIGVHYPDLLYKQVANKVKQQKIVVRPKRSVGTPTKGSTKLPTAEKIVKTKQLTKLAEEINKVRKQPNVNDIVALLSKYGIEVMKEGTNFAVQKNIMNKEEGKFFIDALKKQTKEVSMAPTGRLNTQQKLNLQDLLGYDKIFKNLEDIKINVTQVSKSLENIGARLHIVNAPEGQRVKLPFSLIGNKSATFKKVLLPMIKKATEQGAKTYVEPFGGAGTVYYFVEDMVNAGIEKMYINHFDNEKYQVIKAIKEGKVGSVVGLVDSVYDQIVGEIGEILADIPEVKEIMEEYGVEVGSKEFKEIAEISFYPKYAKQFFEERPDTKLAIKGEVTTTFKEWLSDHLQEEAQKKGEVLEGEELGDAVELILNDRTVFENQYPQISKKISTVLDKYDGVEIKEGDIDTAMLVSMAKHFRQRGDSGQKVVSASSGFQNVVNIRNKMIDGLSKYQKTFEKYGDKIEIYNQDGKEFITDMGKTLNNNKTISYLDPPYVRTTGVYIKQNPELKSSLDEYADTSKINQLFEPIKDSIMMFTNDVDGKYFEALNTMLGDRMSKDIIGYKEGTTPTSLVTTSEISVKPKDVGLFYYKIVKDSFTKDMMKALEKGLLPKISAQLRKQIAKFEQHFMNKMTEKFGDLTKIQEQQFKGKEAFENLENSLESVVSGKDKQIIIREAKKWLKQNIVTGADVIKLIDKINKIWVNKQAKVKELKKEIEKIRTISTIDVESKKAFFDWFNKEYTIKDVGEKRTKEVNSVDNILNGGDFTPEELTIFEKYLSDEKFYDKIEESRKKSISNLDIDQLDELISTVKYYEKIGKEYRDFKDQEFNNEIEVERVKAEGTIKKMELDKPLSASETIKKSNRLIKIGIKTKIKTKNALIEATPMEWVLDEELNLSRLSYNLTEKALNNHRDKMEKIAVEFDKKTKEFIVTKEGWEKISFHGLARRSDGKGKIKLIARMKQTGEDPATFSDTIQHQASENYLTKNEKGMYDYMQEVFKELGKEMQKTKILLDNEIVILQDEYFPIQMDWDSNQDKFADTIDPNTIDNGSQLFRKTKTEQGFTKEATGLEVVPNLQADRIFKTHTSNVSYYINMQKPLKQLNQIVNEWGVAKLGDLGYKFMKNYIDVLARQGVLGVQSGFDRVVAGAVRNFQTAVLGFSPTTMVLQTSAIPEALAIGGNIDLGAYRDIVKTIIGSKETWNMITEKSGVIRNREYKNLFGNEADKWDKSIMDKWNKYGFYGIQKTDAVISRIIWLSEYKRSLKQGNPEADAIYNADTLVKKSMGHTHFEGKAMFVLKNERKVSSIGTVFQNFVLNHSAMLRYGGGKNVQKKYGKILGYMYAFLMAGVVFAMWEEYTRKIGRDIHKQQDYSSPFEKALSHLISFVPYAGIIYGGARYQSINVLSGWKDISNAFDYSDWTRGLKGLGTILGIGGTAEFDRIYKGYIKEEKDKKKSSSGNSLVRDKKTTKRTITTRKKR